MTLLSRGNSKMRKTKGLWSFGLPAISTCPGASACKAFCFATQGAYRFSNVKKAYQWRYQQTLTSTFVSMMDQEIKSHRLVKYIRIHDGGDFYGPEYLQKWLSIINLHPKIQFYAYTKSVHLFRNVRGEELTLPSNFHVVFSYGGKFDALINKKKDAHSQIFTTQKQLSQAGYVNAMVDDTRAARNKQVGLTIHSQRKVEEQVYLN